MKCTCVQCGKTFELSDSEINFYRKKNLHLPKRCQECRQANKQKQGRASKETGDWNTQNQYDLSPRQDNNKVSKWVYGFIAVAVVLLILGIKISRSDFTPYDEDYTYSAETAQNDIGGSVGPGQSEPVNTTQSEQSKDVASASETEAEQVADANSVEPALNDTVNAAESGQAEASISEEPVPNVDIEAAGSIQDSSPDIKQYTFRNTKLLEEHYQKHGIEMGFSSMEEYQAAASAVVNNENSLHKLEAEDGDDVYYLEATNDFVIVSTAGYIRTYFRPDSGIAYYNKQ